MMETFYLPEILNGEALLEMRKDRHARADTIFKEAIPMYEKVLTNAHPNVTIMRLNFLKNELDLGKVQNVEEGVVFVEKNILETVGGEHGLYADLLVLKSNLAVVNKDREQSESLKKQALEIYKRYYPMEHSKIQQLIK